MKYIYRLWVYYVIGTLLLTLLNITLANDVITNSSYIDLRNKIVDAAELEAIYEKVKLNKVGYIYFGAVPQELVELKTKIENQIIHNNKTYRRYPSDFIHGLLAAHVYTNAIENEDVYFPKDDKNHIYNEYLENWKVYKIYNYKDAGDYYGIVYINNRDKQLVLAHRGTIIKWQDLFKSDSALKADLKGILGRDIVVQQAAAYKATKFAITDVHDKSYNFSITGHSLGAWLAELSLFFVHRDFVEIKAKAVTFDSPGSVIHIDQLRSNIINNSADFDMKILDITTYLSPPNFVNSCNKHIGKVYRIFPYREIPDNINNALTWYQWIKELLPWSNKEAVSLEWILSIFDHSLTNILSTFDPNSGKPIKYEEVLDWPVIEYTPYKDETKANMFTNWVQSSSNVLADETDTLKNIIKDSTVMSLVHILSELANGKINQTQYLSYFKYSELPQQHTTFEGKLSLNNDFYLSYAGHYKTKLPNLFEDILNDNNKGSSDWYLKQVKKKDIYQLEDELSQKQLQEIKSQYKIIPSTNYIIVSDKIPIEHLREWIYRIVQVNPAVKDFLEDINIQQFSDTTKTDKKEIIASYIPHDKLEYPIAMESLNKINEILIKDQQVIITGLPGSGKSYYALEYAYTQKDRVIVRWLNADCADKIDIEYRNLACELGINTQLNHNKHVIVNLVNNKIASSKVPLLIVFDDVVEYEHIKDYLLNLPSNTKVIITTRNLNLNNKFKSIKLGPLSRDVATRYIKIRIGDRISTSDTEKLADVLTTHYSEILPYKLSQTVAYIENNTLLTIEKCIEHLKNNKNFEGEITMLATLLKSTPLAYDIIQYAARLDSDFIDIDILKEILIVDDKQLQESIKMLNSVGLIEIVGKDKRGISVHPLIQEEIIAFTEKNAKNKYVIREEIIYNKLLTALNKLFPSITHIPNKDWATARFIYPHVKKILTQKISKNLAIQAELYTKLARYNLHIMNNFKQRFEYEETALRIRKLLYKGSHPAIADSLASIGWAYLHLSDIQKALTYHQQALEMKQAIYRSNHPSIADSLAYIGQVHEITGDAENAVKFYERALKIKQALYPEADRAIAISLNDLGTAYKDLGDVDKALALHEKALAIEKSIYGDIPHPDTASTLNNIGRAYRHLGKLEQALRAHKQALSMLEELYKCNHPRIIDSLNKIGVTYRDLGDIETALSYLRRALKASQELYQGEDHQVTAILLGDVGEILGNANNLQDSLSYYEQALGMLQRLYAGNNRHTARTLDGIGRTYTKLGDTEKALQAQYEGLKMRQALYRHNNPEVAKSLHSIGKTYQTMGKLQKALEYYKQALDTRQALYNGNHHTIAETIASIASVYQDLGNQDEASD